MISQAELNCFIAQLVATVRVKGGCVRRHPHNIIDHARHQGRKSDQRVNTGIEEF